jgi:CRP-like cAMP-binding protein
MEPSLRQPSSDQSGNGYAIQNEILLALPKDESVVLLSKLTAVNLKLQLQLQEAGQLIEFCYFPNTCMVSILTLMTDGKSIEVGLAGRESFVGSSLLAGFRTSGHRAVVQAEGTAYRIDAETFLKVLDGSPELNRLLTRNAHKMAFQVSQIAACNRLHEIEQRLARWLLMTQDRVLNNVLPLTHDFLSQMLGVNRSTVTICAGMLQEAGLIEYRRGKVHVIDRERLEQASCECYGTLKQQLKTWDAESVRKQGP